MENKEKNNSLILDLLVKHGKCIQLVNMLMDANNGSNLDFDITPELYNDLNELVVNSINKLGDFVREIQNKLKEVYENETVKSGDRGENADVQEPSEN